MQSTSQSGDDSSSPDSTPPQYFEKEKAFVESDLIAAVDPLRKAALQEIFASDAWVYQNAPLDSTKLREMRLHDENDSKLFKCLFSSICSKKIDHNTKALEHLEEHLGHKGYACSECGRTFRREYDVEEHKKTHSTRQFSCPNNCGQTFKTTKNIPRHLNTCPKNSS